MIERAPAAGWWQADRDALVAGLVERERAIRRLRAEQDAILAEVTSRGVLAEFGYPTGEALLRDTVHVDRGEARKRLARAVACYPTRAGTVEAPAAGRAHRAGEIDGEHVEAIAGALGELPGEVPVAEREEGERILVELAQRSTPAVVRRAGRHLVARLDPDGKRPRDDEPARPRRELLLGWRRDGRLGFSGVLDRETGQQLQTALSPLAKPRPAENGERDERSTGQRHGDAFAEMIDLVLDEGKLPTEGGEKPRLIVTLPWDELRDAATSSTTDTTTGASEAAGALVNHDMPVTGEQARRIACDAGVIPAVLGTRGEVLDLGREQRLVSTAQRRALTLRDGGCVFPGCDRPHRWCHAHHIHHWADGGTTDLANLALLCGEHHRLIHHSDWQIHPGPDGRPYCTPPTWLTRASHHDLPPPPTHAVA
ncbi:HNH endonuclease [Haloechinothrix alba]|uniref:HNH endonuclease n=1 Tax=Haloechinothrix alba TaxID=664784 RepID=A0A238UY37_9PSEU|nr:HNH endonuclease [Haloechinothrix alba]